MPVKCAQGRVSGWVGEGGVGAIQSSAPSLQGGGGVVPSGHFHRYVVLSTPDNAAQFQGASTCPKGYIQIVQGSQPHRPRNFVAARVLCSCGRGGLCKCVTDRIACVFLNLLLGCVEGADTRVMEVLSPAIALQRQH
jgi:hypothetical protein